MCGEDGLFYKMLTNINSIRHIIAFFLLKMRMNKQIKHFYYMLLLIQCQTTVELLWLEHLWDHEN